LLVFPFLKINLYPFLLSGSYDTVTHL